MIDKVKSKKIVARLDKNYDFALAKEKWHKICINNPEIPIYKKDWFWDATTETPDSWRVIIYEDRNIIAAFPFVYRKIHGMWRIETPWQVARGGFWIDMPEDVSVEKKMHAMNEIVDFIMDKLPQFDYFNIVFDTDFDNWSSFFWRGFKSDIYYTYTICNRLTEEIKNTLSRRRRQRINSGKKKYQIKRNALNPQEIWDFYQKAYVKWNREISFTREQLLKLLESLAIHDAMEIRSAHEDDKLVAVEIALKDEKRIYHQFCVNLPECLDAQSVLVYDTICHAMSAGKKFDFEGSMLKGPAEFYISFFPDAEICYCIHGESNKYAILNAVRRIFTLIKKSIEKRLMGGGYNFIEEKQRWREFCELEESIPIYFKAWYWDATCNDVDDWWVILLNDKQGKIEAAMPFVYQKRKGLYFVEMPWQVAASGVWLRDAEIANKEKALKHLTHIVERIIEVMPYYDSFKMIFYGAWWTWLPFYWNGFEAQPTYTMIIRVKKIDELKSSIYKRRRERINRGEKEFEIRKDELNLEDYWNFFESTYSERGRIIQYEKEKFVKLIMSLQDHNSIQMRGAYKGDELVAVNILLEDKMRLYNQFGAQKKAGDASATSYVIYDAICGAMEDNKIFDFEGSMISGVCEFNSSFNPEWETQYKIEYFSHKYVFLDSIRRIGDIIIKYMMSLIRRKAA